MLLLLYAGLVVFVVDYKMYMMCINNIYYAVSYAFIANMLAIIATEIYEVSWINYSDVDRG